jgi:hypothetical protein
VVRRINGRARDDVRRVNGRGDGAQPGWVLVSRDFDGLVVGVLVSAGRNERC